MKVTRDPFEYPLPCAACNNTWLHHGPIDVYAREEDASRGLHVTVEELTVGVTTELVGNPSLRRDGFTVEFWCETCAAYSLLSVAQHKGQTFITYTVLPDVPRVHLVK